MKNRFRYQIKNFTLFIFILTLLTACDSSAEVSDFTQENLKVEFTIRGADEANPNGDGSGVVEVSAFAEKAVRYVFRTDNGDVIENESGQAEFIFTESGLNTYSIFVRAFAESGKFVDKSSDLAILKSESAFNTLVFSDEFEYEGALDDEKWFHQVIAPNNGSWFNGELQHYTDRLDNSFVSDGSLKIRAIKESYSFGGSTQAYTSARLNTKFTFKYGRVEVKAKLPAAAGTWPAIWTLGANINETGNYFGDQFGSVGWPACGEIDIMEQKGDDKSKTLGFFHWGDTGTGEYKNTGADIPVTNADTEYHIYGMVWDETSIKLTVDDRTVINLPNTVDKPFDNRHYMIFNIAMGGNLGGTVPANFTEDSMEIDYIRIYQ